MRAVVIALALSFAVAGIALVAQQHKITLHGKLFTSGDGDCHFSSIQKATRKPSISARCLVAISVTTLTGTNAKPFTVILIPE